MIIRVPATSANLGCGFDSVGFAVNLYLELEILKPSNKWEIVHELGSDIPCDESNLIITTALSIAPDLPPHKISMTSGIPLTGGLGSSSSALVAGIELACVLGKLELSVQEKLDIACPMEGHPDNVAPAILGGLVIGTYSNGYLDYIKSNIPDVGLVVYVPNYRLNTSAMRKILPHDLPYSEAVLASSISNVMVAALVSGDMAKAGHMMERDMLHEKYRIALVPDLEKVRCCARKHGAYATYLSGAGSAIMCIVPPDKTDEIADALSKLGDSRVMKLLIEPDGAHVLNFKPLS